MIYVLFDQFDLTQLVAINSSRTTILKWSLDCLLYTKKEMSHVLFIN